MGGRGGGGEVEEVDGGVMDGLGEGGGGAFLDFDAGIWGW